MHRRRKSIAVQAAWFSPRVCAAECLGWAPASAESQVHLQWQTRTRVVNRGGGRLQFIASCCVPASWPDHVSRFFDPKRTWGWRLDVDRSLAGHPTVHRRFPSGRWVASILLHRWLHWRGLWGLGIRRVARRLHWGWRRGS